MFFHLSKGFGFLVEPANLLGIMVLASALAAIARWRRLRVVSLSMSAAIVVVFGILPGASWIATPLESRFPAHPALPGDVAGIIALGGTERVEPSATWGQPTLSDPAPIVALLTLARRYPDAKLVFSGGLRSHQDAELSEATVARDFVNEIGTNHGAILYEARSRNTVENAVLTRDLVQPKSGEKWILVTQAISMPRAVGAFRKVGWDVIPYPAGYHTSANRGIPVSFDLLGGLRLASISLHEWVGLIVYRVMGYTDQLFPE